MEGVEVYDGYGYGSGSGDGSGYGDGYDDGSGYGSGSGSPNYWLSCLKYFQAKWSQMQVARLQHLQAAGAKICYWRSDNNAQASNGGRNSPVSAGTVEKEPGPLKVECGRGQLHGTLLPTKWEGERWWVVALIGEVRGDDEKFWALEREIIGECL